ncbi:unnamed protein product [Caretta caretta]
MALFDLGCRGERLMHLTRGLTSNAALVTNENEFFVSKLGLGNLCPGSKNRSGECIWVNLRTARADPSCCKGLGNAPTPLPLLGPLACLCLPSSRSTNLRPNQLFVVVPGSSRDFQPNSTALRGVEKGLNWLRSVPGQC